MGWSLQHDLGRRLAYGDAWALLTMIADDPSTWTGSGMGGLDYPASLPDIAVMAALGGNDWPMPFRKTNTAHPEPSEEERREAARLMTPIFPQPT